MRISKLFKIFLCSFIIFSVIAFPTQASTYNTYNYNSSGKVTTLPDAYMVDSVVTGSEAGCGIFSSPEDIVIYNEHIYIADSGRNRIVKLGLDGKFVSEFKTFNHGGETFELLEPSGIFLKNDLLYIADTGNARILVSDFSCNIKQILTKPDNTLYPQNMKFAPEKLSVDSRGNVYVLCEGVYYGAVMYNKKSEFVGFFGCNEIDVTVSLVADYAWRKFLNYEQRSQLDRYLPVAYSNIDIDDGDFVYVCTTAGEGGGSVRKLNSKGSNVISSDSFEEKDKTIKNTYIDVASDNDGFITCIDNTCKRLLQFDKEGNLLFVFGLSGSRWGAFTEPVAVETTDDSIYVLDKTKGSYTRFVLTDFGTNVRKATVLYNLGEFEASIKPWQDVLHQHSGYETAYVGIGKNLYFSGDYSKATEYFVRANDKEWESKAFREIRSQWLHKYFVIIISGVCILWLLCAVISNKRSPLYPSVCKVKDKFSYHHTKKEKYKFAFYIMAHPIDAALEIREKRFTSVSVASLIYVFTAIGMMLKTQYSSFRYNTFDEGTGNLFIIGLGALLLFLLFTISNWALCVLFDSEAYYKDIFCCLAYSLLPFMISLYASTILSYVLCIDEAMIITVINGICLFWSMIILFFTYKEIHQYTAGKTVLSVLCTLIGLILVAFLLFMIFSLVQQMVSFVELAVAELSYRFL